VRIGRRIQQWIKAAVVGLAPAKYTQNYTDWQPAQQPEGSVVLLTAADPVYFRKFAPAFFSSLLKQHPSASLHFHLCDPDQACLDTLARWRKEQPQARIGYSSEALPRKAYLRPRRSQVKQPWKGLHICC
jgi:hypothetical protein